MTPIPRKAERIRLFSFDTLPMRAFHLSWMAFFLCFFAWFGLAPLMPVVREELGLTPAQVGNTIVASVAATIVARLLVGWLCDRYGPRRVYACLLAVCSLPVMGVGLVRSYESFLLFRLAIGTIGASFVLTQYHCSVMFAPRCVGTANALAAGWGNLGGGVAQLVMPLLFGAFVAVGLGEFWGWRLSMLVAGVACLLASGAYFFFTRDTPEGDYQELRAAGKVPPAKGSGTFLLAARDYRVWTLALAYGACFGIEITIHNVAALYFTDRFQLGLKEAGAVAASFGLLAIFARALGGFVSDRVGGTRGLKGRANWLRAVLLGEGLFLVAFSQTSSLPLAVGALLAFGLFVHMSCGATYAVIPFVNPRALGSVAGIVGAGGNVGAVVSGLLLTGTMGWPTALLLMGLAVMATAVFALLLQFSPEAEETARAAMAGRAVPFREDPVLAREG